MSIFKLSADGTISINKAKKLSPKHLAKLSQLGASEQLAYVMSHLGRRNTHIRDFLPKLKSRGSDDLAQKRPNQILSMFRRRLENDGHIDHRPLITNEKTMWIGVEIECLITDINCGSSSADCCECDGTGTACYDDDTGEEISCEYCDGTGRACTDDSKLEELKEALKYRRVLNCSVRRDGSLDDDSGIELTLLFDANRGFEPLEKLCKVLDDFGAEVDATCGLHVHIDHSGLKADQIKRTYAPYYAHILPAICQLVPKSRLENSYCVPKVSAIDSGERYAAVNLTSFNKHRTVEFRLHSGSTNFEKIKNWIELLIALKRDCDGRANALKLGHIDGIETLADRLGLSDSLIEYCIERAKHFNDGKLPVIEKPVPRIRITDITDQLFYLSYTTEESNFQTYSNKRVYRHKVFYDIAENGKTYIYVNWLNEGPKAYELDFDKSSINLSRLVGDQLQIEPGVVLHLGALLLSEESKQELNKTVA